MIYGLKPFIANIQYNSGILVTPIILFLFFETVQFFTYKLQKLRCGNVLNRLHLQRFKFAKFSVTNVSETFKLAAKKLKEPFKKILI